MSKTTKKLLRVIAGSALLLAAVLIKTGDQRVRFGVYLLSYIIAGGDILLKAVRNIFRGQVFNENFLMSVATAGAFFIGEYPEGIGVMLFYQAGDIFESRAVDKSRKSIASLMNIRPDYANVKRGDKIETTDPDEVKIGDIVIIKAGEKVPLDGRVIDGSSMLDISALTGEPVPRGVGAGDEILSGCININGLLTVKVTKAFGDSTVSKILDLVENATARKARTENFITKFARYYTPAVVFLAVLISVIPPLAIKGAAFYEWIYRGLTFLVISCPCALVLSIPLSFFGGIGGASKKGVLIKGGNYLEALSRLETVAFDKTGTLTKGVFSVQEIHTAGMGKNELLELAAYAENYSTHPISQSLRSAYGKDIDNARIAETEEIPGCGVRAVVDGKTICAGNAKMMDKIGVSAEDASRTAGTVVYIAADGAFAGYIVIADEVRDDAAKAVAALKEAKIQKIAMLTGDSKNAAEAIAKKLGIETVYAGLLPGGKVEKLEELLAQKSPGGKLAFVGDGINDAPVLARADVGVAMGGLGSDAAIEAADVVIMTDEPSKLSVGIKISKKTLGIVRQNIIFTLAIKFTVLILAALGLASMWAGVAADVGVAVLAVLNAARALNVKNL